MILYFSGCGNSRFIANEIARALDEEPKFIPDLLREGCTECQLREGESLGFVFPVYSWASPKIVDDYIKSVQWKGKPGYVWFACTCGVEMGKADKLFKKTLRSVGLCLDASFCFRMPDTYLAFPFFRLDSKQVAERKIAQARRKLPDVINRIRNKESISDVIPGLFPRFKTYCIRPGFLKNVNDRGYHCTDACTGCGKCEAVCPLNNISLENGHPKWNGNCTQCMACYQYCPTNAIHYARYTKGKGQYSFEQYERKDF